MKSRHFLAIALFSVCMSNQVFAVVEDSLEVVVANAEGALQGQFKDAPMARGLASKRLKEVVEDAKLNEAEKIQKIREMKKRWMADERSTKEGNGGVEKKKIDTEAVA